MRWHLVWGATLPLVFLDTCLSPFHPQIASAQQATADRRPNAQPPPLTGHSSAVAGQDRPRPKEGGRSTVRIAPSSTHRLAADPFKYRAPAGSEGFVPAPIDMPEGIRVLGILIMGSGYSLAALQLPGDDEVFYVSEDDDVQIRAATRSGSTVRTPASSSTGRPDGPVARGAGSGSFYLKIKTITPRHVEVYSEHSPTNIQVLR